MELLQINHFYETILHAACEVGNTIIVKHIISLDKIDVTSKTISIKKIFFNKISIKKI